MSRYFFMSPSTISPPSLLPSNASTINQQNHFRQKPYGPSIVDNEVIIESVETDTSLLDSVNALLEKPKNSSRIQPVTDFVENRLADPKMHIEKHKEALADMRKRSKQGIRGLNDNDLTIIEYCERAIAKQIKNGSIQCRLCEKIIYIPILDRRGITVLIDHVVSHLQKEIFWCRLCDYRAYYCQDVSRHLKMAHNLTPSGRFDDKTEEYANEIKALIDYCYGRPEGLGRSPFSLPQDILDQLQKHKCRIVHSRCRDLIMQFAESNRLICNLCMKDFQVRLNYRMVTRSAFDHACDHYGKPVYQCRLCEKWTTGMHSCIRHMKNSHGVGSAGAYIDKMHEHADGILRMLNKCFDKNWKDDGLEGDQENGQTSGVDLSKKIGRRCTKDGLGQTSKSKNVGSDQQGQKYNLRPRPLKKKISGEKVRSKRFELGFLILNPRFKHRATAKVKYIKEDGISYECCHCPMHSKYRSLVSCHIRMMHGGVI